MYVCVLYDEKLMAGRREVHLKKGGVGRLSAPINKGLATEQGMARERVTLRMGAPHMLPLRLCVHMGKG